MIGLKIPLPFSLYASDPDCQIELQPLDAGHITALEEIANVQADPNYFRCMYDFPLLQLGMNVYVYEMTRPKTDTIAFAIVDKAKRAAVGVTRFLHLNDQHRVAEMATWLGRNLGDSQHFSFNKQSKWLMLYNAFQNWDRERIEWFVDVQNWRSWKPLLDVYATPEGMLANHLQMIGGRRRSSIVFGMTRDAWRSEIRDKLAKEYLKEILPINATIVSDQLDRMRSEIIQHLKDAIEESKSEARKTLRVTAPDAAQP